MNHFLTALHLFIAVSTEPWDMPGKAAMKAFLSLSLLVCSVSTSHTARKAAFLSPISFSLPRKSDSCIPFGKEPLNTLMSFWASCLSQASFWASCLSQASCCAATVVLLAATAALLAASTLFFFEVITTEDMLGQKLQEYPKLRSSKMELLQQLHFLASTPPTWEKVRSCKTELLDQKLSWQLVFRSSKTRLPAVELSW